MPTNTARYTAEIATDEDAPYLVVTDNETGKHYEFDNPETAESAIALFNAFGPEIFWAEEDDLLGGSAEDSAEADEPEMTVEEAISTLEAFFKLLTDTEPAEDLPEGEERFVVSHAEIDVVGIPSDIVEDRMTGFEYGTHAGHGAPLAAALNDEGFDVDTLRGKAPRGTYASGDLLRIGAALGA